MMQRIITIIAIVVIVIGGGYYAYQQLVPPPESEGQATVYATKPVIRGDISVGVEATGPLHPSRGGGIQIPGSRNYMMTSSSISYIIDEVLVEEGDSVSKGQLLIKLVAPDLKTQIDNKQQQLKSEREALADLLHVSPDQLDRVDASRGIILHAPIDGRVIGLTVQEGQELKQGEIVARVVNDARFKLVAKMAISEFNSDVKAGQKALLSFSQFDGMVEAKVVDVNPHPVPELASDLLDSQYGKGSGDDQYVFVHWITLEADNPGLVHPGMRARVGLAKNSEEKVDEYNVTWLRFYSNVEGYAEEERVLSRAEAIATRVFVKNMETVKKGDPLVSLAGDDAQKTIQERLSKIRDLETDLQQLRNQYSQLEVVSPIDGVVAYVDAEPGRTVQPGDWLGHIYNTADMRLGTQIDDIDVLMVRQGSPVQVTVDAIPGQTFVGEVTHVSTMGKDMDGITRFYVDIKVEGSPELRPGMQARGYIDAGSAENVLLIPLEAIFEDDGQPKVEVLEDDGTVRLVAVKLGLMNNRFAEVKEGLEEGELVITGSTADLLPSQRIQSKDQILPDRPNKDEDSGSKN
ncbi:MAG: efflux RND transporter periplasmic adaptor subunit [Bacillota bacterium]